MHRLKLLSACLQTFITFLVRRLAHWLRSHIIESRHFQGCLRMEHCTTQPLIVELIIAWRHDLLLLCIPSQEKKKRMHARFIVENMWFLCQISRVLPHGTPLKPFISGAIENKVKKVALGFCVHSNLQLLSFNDPEYHLLQACINVETPSSLIHEPLAPARLGVTRHWTVTISRISVDISVVPTNARTNRVFMWSFSPGVTAPICIYVWEDWTICIIADTIHSLAPPTARGTVIDPRSRSSMYQKSKPHKRDVILKT